MAANIPTSTVALGMVVALNLDASTLHSHKSRGADTLRLVGIVALSVGIARSSRLGGLASTLLSIHVALTYSTNISTALIASSVGSALRGQTAAVHEHIALNAQTLLLSTALGVGATGKTLSSKGAPTLASRIIAITNRAHISATGVTVKVGIALNGNAGTVHKNVLRDAFTSTLCSAFSIRCTFETGLSKLTSTLKVGITSSHRAVVIGATTVTVRVN